MLKEFHREGDVEQEVSAFLQHFDPHATFFRDHFLNIVSTIAERAPILRSDVYDGFSIVSSYELMRRITTDTEHFLKTVRSTRVPETPLPAMRPKDVQPPEHTDYRAALNRPRIRRPSAGGRFPAHQFAHDDLCAGAAHVPWPAPGAHGTA